MSGTQWSSTRTAWGRALALASLAPVAIIAALWLRAAAVATGVPPPDLPGLAMSPPMLAFIAIGTLIAARRPDNWVGWLLTVMGLLELWSSGVLGWAWALALANGAPAAGVLLDISQSASLVGPGILAVLLLIFPSGRAPTDRISRAVLVGVALWMAAVLVAGLVLPYGAPPRMLVQFALQPLVAPAGYVALLVRHRRAGGRERLQLRWVVAAATVLIVVHVTYFAVTLATEIGSPQAKVALIGVILALLLLAAAMSVGILRYQLFDLGRVLRRTVVYAVVSGTVLATYGLVAVLPVAVLGRRVESDLLVAGGTLAAAAAFGPIRRRVQALVDRRFGRAHYDAQRTVASFGARLREEVDLDRVGRDLVAAAVDTVAPMRAGVWVLPRADAG